MANASDKVISPVEIVYISAKFEGYIDPTLYKTLAMLNISRVFDSESIESSVGGIISLYSLMSQSVLEVEEYITTLIDKDGIKLKKIVVTNKADVLKYFSYPDEESQKSLMKHLKVPNVTNNETLICLRVMPQIFKDRFRSLNFHVSSIVVYTGLCLNLMCKKLDKLNYSSWLNNKWKTFFEVIGMKDENVPYGPSKSLFPRLKICKDIYTFFSKHLNLRRVLFLSVMKLSSQTGIWSNLCRTVLKFSKGMEINHICLINTYILQGYPEVIKMNELSEEVNKLSSAFKVFESLPIEQWPYLKIMMAVTDEKLKKSNFPLLTYIAVQIGKRTQPSLSGYANDISSEIKKTAKKILDHIYEENSVSYYNKLKSQASRTDSTKENQVILELNGFKDLLRISDLLEKSLHRSLGINDYNGFDATINCTSNMLPTSKIIYISVPTDASLELAKMISILNILKIYENDSIENVVGGIFSLINLFCVDVKEFKEPFKEYGYELNELIIESSTDIMRHIKFNDEELNLQVVKGLDHANESSTLCEIHEQITIKKVPPDFKLRFLNTEINIGSILAYTSICLALMFKQLSTVNYPSWIHHKWQTFGRVLQNILPNLEFADCCMPYPSLIPSLNISQDIYSFFSTKYSIRKEIFLAIMKLSDSNNFFNWPSLVIGQLAKGTEMNHIFFINDLIDNHPCLMKMRELKQELLRYLSMLEAIQNTKMPEEYWPYLKIILNPAEVEFLNVHQFPTLMHLARSFKAHNFKENYAGGETITPQIESVVEIANNLHKIYMEESYKENISDYFKLDAPNKDLLSSIEDAHIRNLYVISKILRAGKKGVMGKISQAKLDELKNLSTEDAKNKLASFTVPVQIGDILEMYITYQKSLGLLC